MPRERNQLSSLPEGISRQPFQVVNALLVFAAIAKGHCSGELPKLTSQSFCVVVGPP